MPNFFEIFQIYLIPFAIAIPVVLLIFFVGMRKPEAPKIDDIVPEPLPASPPAAAEQVHDHTGGGIDIAIDEPASTYSRDDTPDTIIPVQEVITVLVVDDSAVPRTKLRKLFEGQGFRVETAGDGAQALEIIAKVRFNVVVTDLEMPTMDGFELIAAIQGSLETEDLPVIAITGHEELSARVHDISGLYGIFKKPWNDRELIKRVEALASLRK